MTKVARMFDELSDFGKGLVIMFVSDLALVPILNAVGGALAVTLLFIGEGITVFAAYKKLANG